MPKKIRVMVVDDSAFMRKMISSIVNSDPECECIKCAGDGVAALEAVKELKPDVVTLDIELPEIDGVTCLAYIMKEFPTPVVIVTGFSSFLGEETIKCLEYGAVAFVRKPKGPIFKNIETIKEELVSQIKLASQVDIRKLGPLTIEKSEQKAEKAVHKATEKLVVIASSSGGPRALIHVIPKLPASLKAGVLIIQHIPIEFIASFVDRLDWEAELKVKMAEDGESIQQGKVLVAPTNRHLIIRSEGNKEEVIELVSPLEKEKFYFTSADKAMSSLAPIYGKNATGIVLTGMGKDGTEGLRAIKRHGGCTIAEDESTALVFGMPKSAVMAGVVDKSVPLNKIADEIVKAVGR